MRIVPVVSIEAYLLGRLIRYAFIIGIPIMILSAIFEFIREVVAAFLESAFYARLVAMWEAIITFFEAYGWIFILVFSIIGFITTIVLIYYGIRFAIEWILDIFYSLKYGINRK